MNLRMVACTHRAMSLELREKLAFGDNQIADALARWRDRFAEAELALLSTCNRVELYAAEEQAGGPLYEFHHPTATDQILNAQSALAHYQQTGQSPLSQWQTHLFRYEK